MNMQFYEDSQKILLCLQNPHIPIDVNVHKPQRRDQNVQELIDVLEGEYHYSESAEETKQKDMKLEQLRSIIHSWVKEVAKQKDIQATFIGELLFFGSFKLKVNSHDSDIDTVCLVPHFIDRDIHFFGNLVRILEERKEVTELFPIKEASVPIIRMKFSGILFDLSFARAPPNYNGENIDLNSNQMLLSMDERSYRSFNGCRVAEWIIKKENVLNYENFQLTLKCIKLWASNRGIYSNIIGYLSGIGWTILVAKICQLYPNYPPDQLLERFFFLFSHWKWQDLPVIVEQITEDVANTKLNADQWRAEFRDRNSMMIITPSFPCMNCAHNVSPTTLKIIQQQLQYGNRILNKIKTGEKTYSDLFKPFNFFKRYKHFVQISILATNQNDHLVWKGHVESRLRKLTKNFESTVNSKLIEVHPYPNPFEYSPETDAEGDEDDDDDDEEEEEINTEDEQMQQQYKQQQQSYGTSDEGASHKNSNNLNIIGIDQQSKNNLSIDNLKKVQKEMNKYKYKSIYFYGIRCVSKETNENTIEIDLRDPILKFIECLEMPPLGNVPESMNIYFRHVTRDQIKFREKDLLPFQRKKPGDTGEIKRATGSTGGTLQDQVKPKWVKIKQKHQIQIVPDHPLQQV